MDTTIRINIILILLLSAICGFVIKEIALDRGTDPVSATAYISAKSYLEKDENSAVARFLVNKVLSLGDDSARQPADDIPQAAPAAAEDRQIPAPEGGQPDVRAYFPVATVPVNLAIGSESGLVPAEGRIYESDAPEEKKKSAFSRAKRGKWMAPPPGFFSAVTNNYLIYREEKEVNKDLQKYLEEIHGNFVLDIMPFSMFSKFDRIFLMMFRSKDNYITYTAMPAWSVATTDIDSQAVYIMENKGFRSNLIHELSHIYFDGFFKPALSPLWLSEGFAVRIQSMAQSAAENGWLENEQKRFKNGEYISFKEFLDTKNLAPYSSEDVLVWYAQSYSVVDYLLRSKSRDEFYQFSKNIKEGMPVNRAMYRAYGMPFNNINALEYAWQADLQKDAEAAK
jgi:hypothetical protein